MVFTKLLSTHKPLHLSIMTRSLHERAFPKPTSPIKLIETFDMSKIDEHQFCSKIKKVLMFFPPFKRDPTFFEVKSSHNIIVPSDGFYYLGFKAEEMIDGEKGENHMKALFCGTSGDMLGLGLGNQVVVYNQEKYDAPEKILILDEHHFHVPKELVRHIELSFINIGTHITTVNYSRELICDSINLICKGFNSKKVRYFRDAVSRLMGYSTMSVRFHPMAAAAGRTLKRDTGEYLMLPVEITELFSKWDAMSKYIRTSVGDEKFDLNGEKLSIDDLRWKVALLNNNDGTKEEKRNSGKFKNIAKPLHLKLFSTLAGGINAAFVACGGVAFVVDNDIVVFAPAAFYALIVASPTSLPYKWGSQFMPPNGTPIPYSAMYPPGGIFAHPTVPTEYAADKKRNVTQMLADGASAQYNKAMEPNDPVDTFSGTGLNIGMDCWNASARTGSAKVRSIPLDSDALGALAVHDGWMADEWVHNERDLKILKRKQSNRESARRSRLRKQAEYEELQRRVDTLNKENLILKLELQRLSEECKKVTSENQFMKEELLRICGRFIQTPSHITKSRSGLLIEDGLAEGR